MFGIGGDEGFLIMIIMVALVIGPPLLGLWIWFKMKEEKPEQVES